MEDVTKMFHEFQEPICLGICYVISSIKILRFLMRFISMYTYKICMGSTGWSALGSASATTAPRLAS